jgi:hypothetical protein
MNAVTAAAPPLPDEEQDPDRIAEREEREELFSEVSSGAVGRLKPSSARTGALPMRRSPRSSSSSPRRLPSRSLSRARSTA